MTQVLAQLVAFADEVGASTLAAMVRGEQAEHQAAKLPEEIAAEGDCVRLTRALLHAHLLEIRRALRFPRSARRRGHRLSIARVITHTVLSAQGELVDLERARLVEVLRVERQKFVMANKADAIGMLGERLAALRVGPRLLRWAATQEVQQVSRKLLTPFVERVAAETRRATASGLGSLMGELTTALGDLVDEVPLTLVVPSEMALVPMTAEESLERMPVKMIDRLGLSSRRQVESAAYQQLVCALENDSQAAIERLVGEYDRRRGLVERRSASLIEITDESVLAADRFSHAHDQTTANNMLAVWFSILSSLEGQGERTVAS